MDKNRIGSACWYKINGLVRPGHLRMWAQCGDETLTQPCAVVEDDVTMVPTTVYVDCVCFATVPPWPRVTH